MHDVMRGTTASIPLPGSTVSTSWERITPEVATRYLHQNRNNRPLRIRHLDRLAADMQAGHFRLTHQGIAFDVDGTLLDGQHRLAAVVQSGCPLWALVTRGLPPQAQQQMDGGAKRAASDFLEGQHRTTRAAAARIVLAARHLGRFTPSQLGTGMSAITTADLLALDAATVEALGTNANMAMGAARIANGLSGSSLLGAAVLFPFSGAAFLRGIRDLDGLDKRDPRAAAIRYTGGPGRIQSPVMAFAAIKAARLFDQSIPATTLRVSTTEELTVEVAA